MWRPTEVDPVKASLSKPGWCWRYSPVTDPFPVTRFITPFGRISSISLISSKIESEVWLDGEITIVFPPAMAGASFHAAISSGKFHGIICPTTPYGSRFLTDTNLPPSFVISSSSALNAAAKYLKWSETRGISPFSVSRIGLPLSIDSNFAKCSAFASIFAAISKSSCTLFSLLHEPYSPSKASLAASTALSTSLSFAAANSPSFSPVDGLMMSIYWSLSGFTHSPPIKSSYLSKVFIFSS